MFKEEQLAHEAKEQARWARLNLAAGQFLDRIERDLDDDDLSDLEASMTKIGMDPTRWRKAARS